MTSPEMVVELRELLAKATPGPWEAEDADHISGTISVFGVAEDGREWTICDMGVPIDLVCEAREDLHPRFVAEQEANADLIVAMRNALPQLLDELDRTPSSTSPVQDVGEDAAVCEACLKPILRGQFVHCYEDVGEVHVDCDHPNAFSDDPMAVVLVGTPLRRAALSIPDNYTRDQDAIEQEITAWALAHAIDGATRNDLFNRIRARAALDGARI